MSTNTSYIEYLQTVILEWLLIIIGLGIYHFLPFFSFYFSSPSDWGLYLQWQELETCLQYFGLGYIVATPHIMYFKLKEGNKTKAYNLFQILKEKKDHKPIKQIGLSFILKFFFIPLMYLGLVQYTSIIYHEFIQISIHGVTRNESFYYYINHYLFPITVNITMWIALAVYLFGYCVDNKKLGSKILRIDDNIFSWTITLICYIPFYSIVFYFIPMGTQDYAFFKNEEITAIVRLFLMLVILFKTWTILTLGTKSSNLTNRGITVNGPYKLVRHPHYLAKLIVWWIGLIPSAWHYPWLLGGMIFWTTVYVLRAMTEEMHLSKEKEYRNYMKKVKWRFIPFIF